MKNEVKPEFNVLFIGKNTNFTKEINRHLYSYNENIKFNYKISSDGLNVEELLDFNPQYIIVDFSDSIHQYENIFHHYKQLSYSKNIYIFGIAGILNERIKESMIKTGCSFIYEQSTSLDEAFFLVKSIVLTINSKLAEKKELAAAKLDFSSIIKIPCFLSETTSSHFYLESNFPIKGEKISQIENELIQNKIIYSNENLKILSQDFSFVCPFYKYRTKIEHESSKQSELDDLSNDVLCNPKIPLEDKNDALISLITANNNDKKQNYVNWAKKNRITYDQDRHKRNIILISKKNNFLKLKGKVSQNFVLYQLRSITSSNIKFLTKTNPSFIFYELENPPKTEKYIENPSSELELYLDNPIDYNFIKNLTEIFFHILSLNFKTKVVVFNKTGIPDQEIKDIIGLDVLTALNSVVSEQIIMDYLDEFLIVEDIKNKQVKEKLIDKSLYNEKEKFKTQTQEASIVFRPCDSVARSWISVDGTIELMTENQLLIRSKTDLPCNELLKLNTFVSFNITVLNHLDNKSSDGEQLYHCIINGITSKERDFLRGYVITYSKNKTA